MIKTLIKILLRRPYFKGQYRIFNYLYKSQKLSGKEETVSPLKGKFIIKCNPSTWIGAQIVYLGEYEDYIKETFQKHISSGDIVLDIGANIGFHTLYFSTLVGINGKTIAFEPVRSNFNLLLENIKANNFKNISALNVALGDKNETLYIETSETSQNPGAFSLLSIGKTPIICKIGDEINEIIDAKTINFIKIDVEGYELFALMGLQKTIKRHKPKVVFEYDRNYQLKAGLDLNSIFEFLGSYNYSFYEIRRGREIPITLPVTITSADILAIPN